jgi:coproporphyrinogen III oxidase-like Fe-S oxidoreductase
MDNDTVQGGTAVMNQNYTTARRLVIERISTARAAAAVGRRNEEDSLQTIYFGGGTPAGTGRDPSPDSRYYPLLTVPFGPGGAEISIEMDPNRNAAFHGL